MLTVGRITGGVVDWRGRRSIAGGPGDTGEGAMTLRSVNPIRAMPFSLCWTRVAVVFVLDDDMRILSEPPHRAPCCMYTTIVWSTAWK